MRKSVRIILAAGLVLIAPQLLKAQGGSTQTQTVTMSVTSSDMIRILNKDVDGSGGINGTTGIALTLSGATEAGAAVSPIAADSSTRLRMSCFTQGTDKRKITASITSGGNFLLTQSKLELALRSPLAANLPHFMNYSGSANTGVGTMVTLGDNSGNKSAGTLVSDITTSWSGTNTGDGYEIYYKYSSYPGQVAQHVDPVTITFTIGAQ